MMTAAWQLLHVNGNKQPDKADLPQPLWAVQYYRNGCNVALLGHDSAARDMRMVHKSAWCQQCHRAANTCVFPGCHMVQGGSWLTVHTRYQKEHHVDVHPC